MAFSEFLMRSNSRIMDSDRMKDVAMVPWTWLDGGGTDGNSNFHVLSWRKLVKYFLECSELVKIQDFLSGQRKIHDVSKEAF